MQLIWFQLQKWGERVSITPVEMLWIKSLRLTRLPSCSRIVCFPTRLNHENARWMIHTYGVQKVDSALNCLAQPCLAQPRPADTRINAEVAISRLHHVLVHFTDISDYVMHYATILLYTELYTDISYIHPIYILYTYPIYIYIRYHTTLFIFWWISF